MTLFSGILLSILALGTLLCFVVEKTPVNKDETGWQSLRNNIGKIWREAFLKWLLFVTIFTVGIWAPIGDLAKLLITLAVVITVLGAAIKFNHEKWAKAAVNSAASVGVLYLAWVAKILVG